MTERDSGDIEVFACKCCGECCRGQGGIILGRKDSARLAEFFGIAVDAFHALYAEEKRYKRRLLTGEDGACVFFVDGARCGIHEAKPDICRTWPFFRGNLEDPVSLDMAAGGCPGIAEKVLHAVFARSGARYLLEQGIIADPADAAGPNSLTPRRLLLQMADAGTHNSGEGE